MDTNSHINILSHKREFFNAEHFSVGGLIFCSFLTLSVICEIIDVSRLIYGENGTIVRNK